MLRSAKERPYARRLSYSIRDSQSTVQGLEPCTLAYQRERALNAHGHKVKRQRQHLGSGGQGGYDARNTHGQGQARPRAPLHPWVRGEEAPTGIGSAAAPCLRPGHNRDAGWGGKGGLSVTISARACALSQFFKEAFFDERREHGDTRRCHLLTFLGASRGGRHKAS